jgi:glyoxylate/hydroxypyruvate reductase A
MSIVLIGDLSEKAYERWLGALTPHLPKGETLVLAPRCTDKGAIDIALAANPPWGTLATYPNLRFVQSLWAGVDRVLADPELPTHITIARLVDPAMAQTMVEGTVAAVLYLHRQYPTYLRQQRQHTWRQHLQPNAAHRQIGVLGFGQMGQPVAQALTALGFKVHAWGQRPRSDPGCDYSWGEAGLEKMLTHAEILVNLLPLTAATRGILNARLFERLPAGAALINFGRGGHLQDDDLLRALETQQLSHAVLDVFHQEPLPAEHPFWAHPQITILPHVAASTDPESAAPLAMQNISAFREGRELTGLVSQARGY